VWHTFLPDALCPRDGFSMDGGGDFTSGLLLAGTAGLLKVGFGFNGGGASFFGALICSSQ
jgi:hypothetical protein